MRVHFQESSCFLSNVGYYTLYRERSDDGSLAKDEGCESGPDSVYLVALYL